MEKVFIPKLAQNEAAFVEGKKLHAIIMDAYLVAGFKKPAETIRNACDVFIIDPNTNYFTTGEYLQIKKSFEKLKTAPAEPYKIETLYADEGARKYKFVWESIENQISENANYIILPYLYSDSVEDGRFGLNLTMISDGLKLIEDKNIELPAYAMINLGNGVLTDYQKLDYLIEQYLGDFNSRLEGYFILINKFDCRKATQEELLGLAHLSFHLSLKKQVYFLKLGDFGEILSCIGASGYSSSLAGGEVFNAEGLFKKLTGFGRKHKEVTYVPELLNYLNDEELKKIGYKCKCSVCGEAGIPSGFNQTKAHFLERKLKEMEDISAVADDKKIEFMKIRVEQAIELAEKYNRDYPVHIKTDFLQRWKIVLEKSQYWKERNTVSGEADLDSLIEEAKEQISKK